MTNKTQAEPSLLNNLIFNIVAPVLILSKLTTPERLGPIYGLALALAFPVGYFIYDLVKQQKTNFISIIGFVSILLTGVIGIFEFPSEWIAIKEASVPLIICIIVLVSLKTPFPLVKKLIYNDTFLNINLIETQLEENQNKPQLEKLLTNSTYLLAASFLLSAILNFVLAKILIKSPSGTESFTQELARMTALSYPVIALPSSIMIVVALWYLIKGITKLTMLKTEDILSEKFKEK